MPRVLLLSLAWGATAVAAEAPAAAVPDDRGEADVARSPARPLPALTAATAAAAGTVAAPAPSPAPSPAPAPPPRRYFFHGYDYGSQAIFNPLTNVLNRGFDVLQMRGSDRNPFTTVHGYDVRNVLDNLAHPYARVSEQGRWRFVKEELLPLSWTMDTMRWGPNYSLHLMGGGMTYTALREWYQDHDVPWAGLFAAMTVMTSALINEAIENKGARGTNTDCIADVYFFDLGGILLFSFEPVKRFFSETLVVADWSGQPGLTWPGTALNNQSNNFAFKWSLPFYTPLRLFAHLGMGNLFGLSYRLPSGVSWSLAGGTRATRLTNSSQTALYNVVEFAAAGGVFVDRNESLLASLLVSNVRDYFINFNLYPNAIVRFEPGLGLWGAVSKDGNFVIGLSAIRTFGLGVGAGSAY